MLAALQIQPVALEHINKMGMSVAGLSFKLDQREDQLALAGHLENIDILINNAGAIPGGAGLRY